jgi:hypothetical protein
MAEDKYAIDTLKQAVLLWKKGFTRAARSGSAGGS